jgi:hypothetical protein
MKYIKYIYSLLTLIVILITGCSEDFLDLKPIARGTTESFYTDESTIDATVTAAYAELCAREVFDKDYYLYCGSLPGDDCEAGGENISDWPAAQHTDEFLHTLNDETSLLELYRYCYKGLRMCNTALERLQIAKDEGMDISDDFIAKRTGEMKFLSAWYHFTLVQVFGGVPIASEPVQPADFYSPRNTIKEVFSYAEGCLKDAIELLPEKRQLGEEVGRATKGAAQALLAKLLIYESGYARNYPGDYRFEGCQERWQEALNYADAVINSTANYSLVGASGERYYSWRTGNDTAATIDGYRWLWTVDGDNSSEAIFEIQSVNDLLAWGYTRANCITVYQTVRRYKTRDGSSGGDYGGWSWNSPTQLLVDAYGNSDSRETNLHSQPANPEDDPRFSTTIGSEGDSILLGADNTWVFLDLSNLPAGHIGRKFECSYDEYWGHNTFWGNNPMNVRLIRLADIYLMAAEAAFRVNDQTKALSYVNAVRTRARNCGTTGYPQDLTAISFEDIVHERRLELACEPFRFFDLVRWGLAEEFLDGVNVAALGPDFHIDFEPGKHEFFPLPITEVQLSRGSLVNYEPWQ